MAIDPSFVLVLLQKVEEIMEDAHKHNEMSPSNQQEVTHIGAILLFVASSAGPSEACVRTVVGPQAKAVYVLLRSILSSAPSRIGWDTRGFLRTALLPSLSSVVENIHKLNIRRRAKLGACCSLHIRSAARSSDLVSFRL